MVYIFQVSNLKVVLLLIPRFVYLQLTFSWLNHVLAQPSLPLLFLHELPQPSCWCKKDCTIKALVTKKSDDLEQHMHLDHPAQIFVALCTISTCSVSMSVRYDIERNIYTDLSITSATEIYACARSLVCKRAYIKQL